MTILTASEVSSGNGSSNCECGSGEQTFRVVLLNGKSETVACDICERFTVCEDCGANELEANSLEFEGYTYCCACLDARTAVCGVCDERRCRDTITTALEDGFAIDVCENCLTTDNFLYCERCKEYTNDKDNAGEVKTHARGNTEWGNYGVRPTWQVWCGGCFESYAFACDSCSTNFDSDRYEQYLHSGDDYCADCFSETFTCCAACSDTVFREDICYDEHSGDDYCVSCYERYNGSGSWRGQLSRECAKQKFGFKATAAEIEKSTHTGRALLFLGVELELEAQTSDASHAFNVGREALKGFATFKSDGSLDDGFELNTPPATFDYHTTQVGWEKALDAFSDGFAAASSCGLHVHVSRAPLSTCALRLMAEFIYSPENARAVRAFAGRESVSYARFTGLVASDVIRGCRGRYVALNFHPTETVEFRMFAATLDAETFLTRLEFVQALVEFAQARSAVTSSDEESAPTFESFAEFVLSQAADHNRFLRLNDLCGRIQVEYTRSNEGRSAAVGSGDSQPRVKGMSSYVAAAVRVGL